MEEDLSQWRSESVQISKTSRPGEMLDRHVTLEILWMLQKSGYKTTERMYKTRRKQWDKLATSTGLRDFWTISISEKNIKQFEAHRNVMTEFAWTYRMTMWQNILRRAQIPLINISFANKMVIISISCIYFYLATWWIFWLQNSQCQVFGYGFLNSTGLNCSFEWIGDILRWHVFLYVSMFIHLRWPRSFHMGSGSPSVVFISSTQIMCEVRVLRASMVTVTFTVVASQPTNSSGKKERMTTRRTIDGLNVLKWNHLPKWGKRKCSFQNLTLPKITVGTWNLKTQLIPGNSSSIHLHCSKC